MKSVKQSRSISSPFFLSSNKRRKKSPEDEEEELERKGDDDDDDTWIPFYSKIDLKTMEEGGVYGALSSSHFLGSVPAVIKEEKRQAFVEPSQANPQIFAPAPVTGGYQAPGTSYGDTEQGGNTWKGVFNVSSYIPFFNVDTDIVIDRVISSINSFSGDFFGKIDANPDLYGPVWTSTTLIFMLGALGNCATYLMQKKTGASAIWNFDVNYFNWAACVVYAYVVAVPAAFYFLFQYFAVSSSLVRLWCMWGYSLCVFIPCSLILIIPVEMLRWFVIILAGASSGSFIAMNLKTYTEEKDLMMLVVTAFLLQFSLAIFIKIFFFV